MHIPKTALFLVAAMVGSALLLMGLILFSVSGTDAPSITTPEGTTPPRVTSAPTVPRAAGPRVRRPQIPELPVAKPKVAEPTVAERVLAMPVLGRGAFVCSDPDALPAGSGVVRTKLNFVNNEYGVGPVSSVVVNEVTGTGLRLELHEDELVHTGSINIDTSGLKADEFLEFVAVVNGTKRTRPLRLRVTSLPIKIARVDFSKRVCDKARKKSALAGVLTVGFRKDVTDKRIKEILSSVGGTAIGGIALFRTYQVRFDSSLTFERLAAIVTQLRTLPEVRGAGMEGLEDVWIKPKTDADPEKVAALLAVPETIKLGGQTYRLETFLSRNLMPGSVPSYGAPLRAAVIVIESGGQAIPAGVDVVYQWVIRKGRVWATPLENTNRSEQTKGRLRNGARGGPLWGSPASVDVVVQLVDQAGKKHLLRASKQEIHESH